VRRRRFLQGAALLLAPAPAAASDYPPILPGRALAFPRDAGAHPEFRVEWWYVTAWVEDTRGAPFGVQITFFRDRPMIDETNPSRFAPRELLFAHAALADPRLGRLRHDQRAAREGFGLASSSDVTTDVQIDDWSLKLAGDEYAARIAARDFSLDLRFSRTEAVLLHGDSGFSRKGADPVAASYYYSEPQLAVSGSIAVAGENIAVHGRAWLDHEWSSEGMPAGASGWDWTGINLDHGGALMAFRMRDRSGGTLWAGGSLRSAGGATRSFAPGEIAFEPRRRWRSPRTGIDYPVAMALRAGQVECILEPLMDDQELDALASTGTIYWEGAMHATQAGRSVGRGYLELTGYGKPLKLGS
jgi:predicted secreted hydrolase